MTTVLVVFGTTLFTLAVLAVLWTQKRRSEVSTESRIAHIVHDLNARMEALGRDLTDALDRAQQEGRRNRFLGELAGSIDLDEVIGRTLDAAGALPGVDAALLTIVTPDGATIVESVGLTPTEASEHAVQGPGEGVRLRSISIDYEAESDSGAIAAGLAVPIRGDHESFGLLTVFTRSDAGLGDESLAPELEALALRAGPAIENARRFREARQLADLDALTALHNRRYFHETLGREVARAHRYSRRLALILFDLDDFKAVNDRIGHLAGDTVLAEIAERVRDVVRTSDVPCRVGGDEFGVILPESTLEDADQLYARLQEAVAARPTMQAGILTVSAGVAELKPDDTPTSFFQRADEALYRAKAAGKGRVEAEPNSIGNEGF